MSDAIDAVERDMLAWVFKKFLQHLEEEHNAVLMVDSGVMSEDFQRLSDETLDEAITVFKKKMDQEHPDVPDARGSDGEHEAEVPEL